MERGKFIVIYGANNLGKTVQAMNLTERLAKRGIKAEYLKYPIYELPPTGPRLNSILRERKEDLSPLDIQKIFAQNRRDYEPFLIDGLHSGKWYVAEDYRKTGIAWGMTFGIALEVMEEINSDMYPEDLEICLDGERFVGGIEKGHLHEESGKWERNREIHRILAKRYGWEIINANNSIEYVSDEIMKVVIRRLFVK